MTKEELKAAKRRGREYKKECEAYALQVEKITVEHEGLTYFKLGKDWEIHDGKRHCLYTVVCKEWIAILDEKLKIKNERIL